jgi:hypothetical protein
MLQQLSDFWYTITGGWWLHHKNEWVRIELLGTVISMFQGKVHVFKKEFDWEFPALVTHGIWSYRAWSFMPVLMDGYLPPGMVHVCLNRRIKH